MSKAFVGLGSNVGDRVRHLRRGVQALGRTGEIVRVSSLYETEPVGGPPQGLYLNAVLEIETDLTVFRLLQALQAIEQAEGRERTVPLGPRTLDLDLLWWNGETMRSDTLTLPHPRAHERRFVLEPWVEVWPEGTLCGRPLVSWKERAGPGGVRRREGPGWVTEAGL